MSEPSVATRPPVSPAVPLSGGAADAAPSATVLTAPHSGAPLARAGEAHGTRENASAAGSEGEPGTSEEPPCEGRLPTAGQAAVLACGARVRLVRAAPGSGKTWLVAEAIREELARWTDHASGIAALSFTRVGGEEIRRALGRELGHPHAVQTLDAFMFRYVVQPHLTAVFPEYAPPHLLPGEHEPHANWSAMARVGALNAFGCSWAGLRRQSDGERVPELTTRDPKSRTSRTLDAKEAAAVRARKEELWREYGFVTHSDVAYLAFRILRRRGAGAAIRALLVRRFPLLVVDELQDTGYFLAASIAMLLREGGARGLLVGDPDQAIFEFNGARPELFDGFAQLGGVKEHPLPQTRRCPAAVVRAARAIKPSPGSLVEVPGGRGHAFLVPFAELERDVPRVMAAVARGRDGQCVKLVARGASAVDRLTGGVADHPPALGAPALGALHRAVRAFRLDRPVPALAAARTAAGLALFGREAVRDRDLETRGIPPLEWKALAIRLLFAANGLPTADTAIAWQTAAGAVLRREAVAFGHRWGLPLADVRLTPKQMQKHLRTSVEASIPSAAPPAPAGGTTGGGAPEPRRAYQAETVHAVKGETHDVTVFVCPKPVRGDRCPSRLWWSPKAEDREERRIAYVAATRSRGDFVLCVHESTFGRLTASRAEFVASFDVLAVDELERRAARSGVPLCVG